MKQKKLMIVDMSSFIFRAFYAIRPLTSPSGKPVNAVYGVLTMLLKLLEDFSPTHFLLARDSRGDSVRKAIYPEYKANRSAPPDDLIPQFELIEQLINLMNVSHMTFNGYEADDLIGSVVTQWKDQFEEILIASSDKDLMQFIGQGVSMVDTKLEKTYGVEDVIAKMGVRPDQIVDYLSLVGDSSDNIPGVSGIGAKGAQKLLAQYGTLEECFKNRVLVANKKLQTSLENGQEMALLSKSLVEIRLDLPLSCSEEKTQYVFSPTQPFYDFLQGLGFKSLIKRLQEKYQNQNQNQNQQGQIESVIPQQIIPQLNGKEIATASDLNSLRHYAEKYLDVAFHCIYENEDQLFNRKLTSIAFTFDGESFFFSQGATLSLIEKELWDILLTKKLIGHDLQKEFTYLNVRGWLLKKMPQYIDISVAHYLLYVEQKHHLEHLSESYFPLIALPENDSLARTQLIWKLKFLLMGELAERKLDTIFQTVDNPLVAVLAKMQKLGIMVDIPYFEKLSQEFALELESIEKKIEEETGFTINLRSPKQVSDLLFEKLKLPAQQQNKTAPSTNQEVLEELASMGLSIVPSLILRYRELDKLYSTYVSVLPKLVAPEDERLHSQFHLTVTATGRLSSDRPNLQNIPIRGEDGRRIRKGFLAPKGHLFLSADYSQIELRILAHFSDDPIMVYAFQNDLDIHTQTACEIFGKELKEVTGQERGWAKTVNFALMYGQSSFGLAKNLGISRKDAKDYIDRYFEKFSRVKSFLDGLKERCREVGLTETLLGRVRYLPEIHSKNHMVRANAERLSVNTPIQGTAADLIKVAMLKIDQRLRAESFSSRLVLQVHDELIFEVPEKELEAMKELVKHEMEHAMLLKIPLKVDVGVGQSWYDLKN